METKESISGTVIKLLISSVKRSMICFCCLLPSHLATVPIYLGGHACLKSVSVSRFHTFFFSCLSSTTPAFLVLFFSNIQSLKSKVYRLISILKIIFLPVFPNSQICLLLNLCVYISWVF